MKQIETNTSKLLIIKVPELAFYFDWNYCKKNYDDFNNPKIQIYWETEDDRIGGFITNFKSAEDFNILGKLSELSEEKCSRFVKYIFIDAWFPGEINLEGYKDYSFKLIGELFYDKIYKFKTAKESLISLLQSNDIDTSKNLLIIEVL